MQWFHPKKQSRSNLAWFEKDHARATLRNTDCKVDLILLYERDADSDLGVEVRQVLSCVR